MATFWERIIVNNEGFDFEFSEVCNPSGSKYFVAVYYGYRHIVSFEMKKAASGWSIVPPAPEWINQLQELLSRTIACKTNKGF